MDNDSDRLATSGAVQLLHANVRGRNSQWLHDRWRPLFLTEYEHTTTPGTWRLSGAAGGMSREFFIQADHWNPASLVQVRRKDGGAFELSAAVPSEDGNVYVMQVPAFDTVRAAAISISRTLEGRIALRKFPPDVAAPNSTRVPTVHSFKAVDDSLFRLGWRPVVVEDAVENSSFPHCWRISGLWFGVSKFFHVHAPWWHSVTHLQARRVDEHRFSLAVLCATQAGDAVVHLVDAFDDAGRLEATCLTPALATIRQIEQLVRPVDGEPPLLLMLVGGQVARDALRELGHRMNVRQWDLEEVFGDLFARFEPGDPSIHSEFRVRAAPLLEGNQSPILLHGLKALLRLAPQLNPVFALMLLAAGAQVVALWPGTFTGEHLQYCNEGSSVLLSYPAEGLVVHCVDEA